MRKTDSPEVRKKHPLAVIWGAISWLLVAAVVLLAVALVGVRLIGYTPYAVLSGSMTPKYQVGDLVYVRATPPEQIQVGDVMTYTAGGKSIVTHRVVEIDQENRQFITKGDANNDRDVKPVAYENVIGTVAFSLPKLGYVSNYLTSPSGRYVAMIATFAVVLVLIIPELFRKKSSVDESK